MSNNTIELLKIILENDNPEQAILTASAIIFDYAEQLESYQEPTVVCHQENSQMPQLY